MIAASFQLSVLQRVPMVEHVQPQTRAPVRLDGVVLLVLRVCGLLMSHL